MGLFTAPRVRDNALTCVSTHFAHAATWCGAKCQWGRAMKIFSSLAAVMALWLTVSFLLWLAYRVFRRRDGSRQERVLGDALGLLDEADPVFATIRTRASTAVSAEGNYRFNPGQPEETLRADVRSLLNTIEAQSGYFERVNAAKKMLQQTFGVPDVLALSELLQIRRDFWAASEIFLMDGIQELGPEFADLRAFEAFQAEARALLFNEGAGASGDPVELRLAIAREDALTFRAEARRAIAAGLEKSRFPTAREFVEIPLGLLKATAMGLREFRSVLGDAAATAQNLARVVTSKGLKAAAEELRRARTTMPGQFATAFERAGGLARQGGQNLKRHYEFVLEAQELRARYAELLARAPELSEKGKQFLARLELERRAEQFRDSSNSAIHWTRQALVVGIAYTIAGLQFVQAKITPPEHKQLAPLRAAAAPEPAGPEPEEEPLRVLLLPASAYSGGNYGFAHPAPLRRRRAENRDSEPAEGEFRLRDYVSGGAAQAEEEQPRKPAAKAKARKPAKARAVPGGASKTTPPKLKEQAEADEPVLAANRHERTGSLLDRLASVETAEKTVPASAAPESEKPKAKGSWFPFGGRRK